MFKTESDKKKFIQSGSKNYGPTGFITFWSSIGSVHTPTCSRLVLGRSCDMLQVVIVSRNSALRKIFIASVLNLFILYCLCQIMSYVYIVFGSSEFSDTQ